MARISGVEVPDHKRGPIALTYIFGIGLSTAKKILQNVALSEDTKVSEWGAAKMQQVRDYISEHCTVEGERRGEVRENIKRYQNIGCLRGIRHRNRMPVRGQRTKNNTRTLKGTRKTVAGKKKATKK